jgi:hypothetical protein
MAAAWRAILVEKTLIVFVGRLLSLWLLLLRVGWRLRAPFSLVVGDGITGICLGLIGMSGGVTLVMEGL